jgi:hypothetical protein
MEFVARTSPGAAPIHAVAGYRYSSSGFRRLNLQLILISRRELARRRRSCQVPSARTEKGGAFSEKDKRFSEKDERFCGPAPHTPAPPRRH